MWERAELEAEILRLLAEAAAVKGIFGPDSELDDIGAELTRLLIDLRSGLSIIEVRRKLSELFIRLERVKKRLFTERWISENMTKRLKRIAKELEKEVERLLKSSCRGGLDDLFDELSEKARELYVRLYREEPPAIYHEDKQRDQVHV